MFWVIIAVVVVGYFIVRAINKNSSQNRAIQNTQTLRPIDERIAMVKDINESNQSYLADSYKKEIDEFKKLKHTKRPKYSWKTWSEDNEKILRDRYRDFTSLVALNASLCQRLYKNDEKLLDQLVDWGTYLELTRDMYIESIGVDAYIDAGLDLPYDEVTEAERRGNIVEIHKRMMNRAKENGLSIKYF